jgi:hypothetical protein
MSMIDYVVNQVSADLPSTRDRVRAAVNELLEVERARINTILIRETKLDLKTLEYINMVWKRT